MGEIFYNVTVRLTDMSDGLQMVLSELFKGYKNIVEISGIW